MVPFLCSGLVISHQQLRGPLRVGPGHKRSFRASIVDKETLRPVRWQIAPVPTTPRPPSSNPARGDSVQTPLERHCGGHRSRQPAARHTARHRTCLSELGKGAGRAVQTGCARVSSRFKVRLNVTVLSQRPMRVGPILGSLRMRCQYSVRVPARNSHKSRIISMKHIYYGKVTFLSAG